MKLRYTLAVGALALATTAQAQTWINDTISTEAGYLKNIYYSLEDGEAGSAPADNWHIGFSAGVFSASIITNSADKGVKLYMLDVDTTQFGTDLTGALATAVTATPMSLYNSNIDWENGAFNNTTAGAGYGWGDYNMSSHWIEGRKVFGLVTPTDTFQIFIVNKQTYMVTNAPVYHFKIAKINGSGAATKTLTIGGSSHAGRNFAYYNVETDAFFDREPLLSKWDFVFSSYNDAAVVMGNTQYKVFGVINNKTLKVARVDTADAQFDNLVYSTYAYDTVINSIGRAWKASGQSGVVITDSLCYFAKVANGDVWQLVFTYHTSGSATTDPGVVGLKKRKVYTVPPAGVKELNAFVSNMLVVPNPTVANGNTALLVDMKQDVKDAQLTIVDLNGRVVSKTQKNIRAGFQQIPLNVGQYPAGVYMIHLSGAGFSTTQKMVVK